MSQIFNFVWVKWVYGNPFLLNHLALLLSGHPGKKGLYSKVNKICDLPVVEQSCRLFQISFTHGLIIYDTWQIIKGFMKCHIREMKPQSVTSFMLLLSVTSYLMYSILIVISESIVILHYSYWQESSVMCMVFCKIANSQYISLQWQQCLAAH